MTNEILNIALSNELWPTEPIHIVAPTKAPPWITLVDLAGPNNTNSVEECVDNLLNDPEGFVTLFFKTPDEYIDRDVIKGDIRRGFNSAIYLSRGLPTSWFLQDWILFAAFGEEENGN